MQKKFQIFISSTFRDLQEERQDAVRMILDLGHIPSGMEGFPASDVEQFEYIKKIIDECDYYVLIIGARYGSVDDSGISYTQKEYEYAKSTGKIVLAFIHDKPENISLGKADTSPELVEKLASFKKEVSTGRLIKHWNNRDQLQAAIAVALSKAFISHPAVGWIRGDAVTDEMLLKQINDIRIENEKLKERHQPDVDIDIDNIANLEELFTLRYEYRLKSERLRGYDRDSSIDLTWKQIAVMVGRGIMSGSKTVSDGLSSGISEVKNIIIRKLRSEDVFTIRVQLVQLGIIVENGTLASITERGRRLVVENTIVRST